ncbi:MAG: hypothetical protein GY694_06690 [Gammaproteobacteria bacterium]|nr:hypothetical protein [Gammaproteobacteria bacterium]
MNTPPTPLPLHGVLLELNGLGIYLIGASGIGKSETALQLIHQGASLICDDAPDFLVNKETQTIFGHCPEGFHGLMHIHDLGIINVRELFGLKSFKTHYQVDFIIELKPAGDTKKWYSQQTAQQLLTPSYQHWQYQTWTIPGIHLHLHPDRNIPLLINTAILQFSSNRLKKRKEDQ